MIRPDMATMLCFVCTDAEVPAGFLETALKTAADRSFNRITVDGDTSTNDTVILMANGLSGAVVDDASSRDTFGRLLDEVLIDLAKRVVRDGEGATKLVEIAVRGAGSDGEAHVVADTIANSSLVKTAFFGEDANWGRILAAAGRAGVAFDPERVDIFFEDVLMFRDGAGFGEAVEAAATAVLKKPEFTISVDLRSGERGRFGLHL
jgi:glutamate N-acetyltransferase / amino-acid N-acetyltransferase